MAPSGGFWSIKALCFPRRMNPCRTVSGFIMTVKSFDPATYHILLKNTTQYYPKIIRLTNNAST